MKRVFIYRSEKSNRTTLDGIGAFPIVLPLRWYKEGLQFEIICESYMVVEIELPPRFFLSCREV